MYHQNQTSRWALPVLGIFALYVLLRLLAWKNTILLEDTDSLSYLNHSKVLFTLNLQEIINIDADQTPFYLFFTAIFALMGWSIETAARACSLAFSLLLFLAIGGIGRQLGRPLEVTLGLLFLSVSPALISLSFAILTEPSYIATIYLGLWLFWTQYQKPEVWKAVLIGCLFGFSFLNRLEGIVYLTVIPFMQGLHFFLTKHKDYTLKHLVEWVTVFALCFVIVVAPQVWRVSELVGQFALNGRQVWSVVLNKPDGRSYPEKIYGLDHSPSEINIAYLKRHPQAWKDTVSTFNPTHYVRTVVRNFRDLYTDKLSLLLGPLGLIFFAFGILSLLRSNRVFELALIATFIGTALVPPLLHTVVVRHIAVIAPAMWLVAGIGVVYFAQSVLEATNRSKLSIQKLSLLFAFLLIGASAPSIRAAVFNPPTANNEYSPKELKEPVRIVRDIANTELRRTPVIAARKGYLAYLVQGHNVFLPYADLKRTIQYLELNHVDFLYLKESRAGDYPFYREIMDESVPPNFVLLYEGLDAAGGKLKLYRFLGARGK